MEVEKILGVVKAKRKFYTNEFQFYDAVEKNWNSAFLNNKILFFFGFCKHSKNIQIFRKKATLVKILLSYLNLLQQDYPNFELTYF